MFEAVNLKLRNSGKLYQRLGIMSNDFFTYKDMIVKLLLGVTVCW